MEDSDTQRAIIELMCESFDFELYSVATGEEALAACELQSFSAILMDLGLPGIGGLECSRRIRELDRKQKRPRTPIIAVTAHKDARESCLKAGMDDYISKPFGHEAFRVMLLRWAYQHNRPNLRLLKSPGQENGLS